MRVTKQLRHHRPFGGGYNVSTIEPPAPAEPLPSAAEDIQARVEAKLEMVQNEDRKYAEENAP